MPTKLLHIACFFIVSLAIKDCWSDEPLLPIDTFNSTASIVETADTVAITVGNRTLLEYRKTPPPLPDGMDPVYSRSGLVHPVTTPAGNVVTAAYPADHPHQNGIFSAWVQTTYAGEQIDFWNLFKKTGRVRHDRVIAINEKDEVSFQVELIHEALIPATVDVLKESWKITLVEASEQVHCFDLELQQSALTDLPLAIAKYHYGGFGVRGPDAWLIPSKTNSDAASPQVVFSNDSGSNRIAGNHQQAKWVSLTGPSNNGVASIIVMSHAKNFRSPQCTRLHPTMPYFCFAPCIEEPFVIDRQHDYKALYRIYTLDHEPDQAWLADKWQAWNN